MTCHLPPSVVCSFCAVGTWAGFDPHALPGPPRLRRHGQITEFQPRPGGGRRGRGRTLPDARDWAPRPRRPRVLQCSDGQPCWIPVTPHSHLLPSPRRFAKYWNAQFCSWLHSHFAASHYKTRTGWTQWMKELQSRKRRWNDQRKVLKMSAQTLCWTHFYFAHWNTEADFSVASFGNQSWKWWRQPMWVDSRLEFSPCCAPRMEPKAKVRFGVGGMMERSGHGRQRWLWGRGGWGQRLVKPSAVREQTDGASECNAEVYCTLCAKVHTNSLTLPEAPCNAIRRKLLFLLQWCLCCWCCASCWSWEGFRVGAPLVRGCRCSQISLRCKCQLMRVASLIYFKMNLCVCVSVCLTALIWSRICETLCIMYWLWLRG